MSSACSICRRRDRDVIDGELRAGRSLRDVAAAHPRASKSSLERHRRHVRPGGSAKASPWNGIDPPVDDGGSVRGVQRDEAKVVHTSTSSFQLADRLQAAIETRLAAVESDPNLRELDRSRVLVSLSQSLVRLRELRGEELTQAQLVKHPAVRRVFETIMGALGHWPDALKAVVAELALIQARPGGSAGG